MTRAATDPVIGWFMLSEADRVAAARHLATASDGTRDELGFAPIHFAFADRFFPGTSVQHAQLRYVLFVAWTYEELREATAGDAFPDERLAEIEERFSRRLMDGLSRLEHSGISGWMKYKAGDRPVVRASTIYWSALKRWGVLKPRRPGDEPPYQTEVHRSWPRLLSYEDAGDGAAPVAAALFDPTLSKPPQGWRARRGALGFDLAPGEAAYFKEKWRGASAAPPLLSKLADAGVAPISLWSRDIRRLADTAERAALDLARDAASLACVARAAHAALIEAERNRDLVLSDDLHSSALEKVVPQHRDRALALDIEALGREACLNRDLRVFLGVIQGWLRDEAPVQRLHAPIAFREHALKDGRAYLSNSDRRHDWSKGPPQPLDYRWPTVRHLIETVREDA